MLFLSFSILHGILWFTISLFAEIHPDMADHWVWSRDLFFGYLEHPPMIAVLMKLSSFFSTDPILALKIGAAINSTLLMATGYTAARQFLSNKQSLLFLLLLESTLYFSIGSIFWSIEQPFNLFWFLSLWCIGKLLKTNNKKWLIYLGVFCGLGGASKYIMILFYVILFLWLLLDSKNRRVLKSYELWLGGIIAFVIVSPVFYWNYINDWFSFKFVLSKGLGGDSFSIPRFFYFTIGHLLLFSIFLSLPAWFFYFRKNYTLLFYQSTRLFFSIHTLIPIIFFSIASLQGKTADPNWINTSYISLYIMLSKYFDYLWKQGKKILPLFSTIGAFAFNIFIIVLIFFHWEKQIFSGRIKDRLNESYGWQKTAQAIEKIYQKHGLELPQYIISEHYQLGTALSLYLPSHPLPFSLSKEQRNLWVKIPEITQGNTLLIFEPKNKDKVLAVVYEKINKKFVPLEEFKIFTNKKLIKNYMTWKIKE